MRSYLFLLLYSVALCTHAQSPATVEKLDASPLSSAVEVEPKTLWMGTSDGPPYMIQATNSGLDIDIPRAVLARLGYQLKIRYMSLSRAAVEVQSGRLDLMAPIFVSNDDAGHRSNPHVWYRPSAFSLAHQNLSVASINDLGRYRMTTFQGATGYFGDEFIRASESSPHYSESYNMAKLPRLLMADRTDVVVLDYYIFRYFWKQLDLDAELTAVTVHDIFPKVPATVMFFDEALRNQFNVGLEQIQSDGSYQKIIDHYER